MLDAPAVAAFAAAHVAGDFALQTRPMLNRKARWDGLALHGAIHVALVLAAFAPWLLNGADIVRVAVAAAAVGVSHVVIDAVKARGPAAYRESWWGFLVDQALHVAVIAAVVQVLPFNATGLETYRHSLVVAAGAIAAGPGSMHAVRLLLDGRRDNPAPAPAEAGEAAPATPDDRSGRAIGVLERLITALFVALGQFAAVGLIVAAKSVARFDRLKERAFAEDYLIGTLASLLAATVIGLAVRAAW